MHFSKLNRWGLATLLAVSLSPASYAKSVKLDIGVGTPVLLAGQTNRAYVKVSLFGTGLERANRRAPANIAVVLDKSGSMQGDKIRRAREAAVMVVDMLNGDDVLSIVSYDDTVRVVVPATKLYDKPAIKRAIRAIESSGSTALFAGVSRGAAEVRKFFELSRVNRVILLSDGLANVGPKTPAELGALGASFGQEGISVTTIGLGLGYNEDLMTQLAQRSDGNHAFAENATDLAQIFSNELGDVLSVVAQNVYIEINFPPGVRPIRLLGREAEIRGQRAMTRLQQLYNNQEKYLILEVEVPPGQAGRQMILATVSTRYRDLSTQKEQRQSRSVSVTFSPSAREVKAATRSDIMSDAVGQLGVQISEKAVQLRDKGKVKAAQAALREGSKLLKSYAADYDSAPLAAQSEALEDDARLLEKRDEWRRQRKIMRKKEYERKTQQSY